MKPVYGIALSLIVGLVLWAYAKDRELSSVKTADAVSSEPVERLEKGTVFTMILQTPLSSEYSRAGDPVKAVLTADVVQNGVVVFAGGTEVHGQVSHAVSAADSKDKRGRLGFELNRISGPGGPIPVTMTLVSTDLHESLADRTARTRTQLAGTTIGALLGINMADNEKKNKVKGGLMGGAAGLAVGSLIAHQQGVDVEIGEGSRIRARITHSVSMNERE